MVLYILSHKNSFKGWKHGSCLANQSPAPGFYNLTMNERSPFSPIDDESSELTKTLFSTIKKEPRLQ